MTRTLEDYYAMLEAKHITIKPSGFTVTDEDIHPKLHKFQRHITRWSLHLGRAAIFAGVGLGKTYMQVEAARLIAEHTGGQVLILAPLGVTEQTIELAATELGVKIIYSESQEQLNDFMRVRRGEDVFEIDESNRLVITNYDRVHLFDVSRFAGVILDECFAAGTPIDCVDEAGRVYQNAIENVQVGDRIINASGVDIVSDIHRREVPYAIKVRVNGTEIITSPNHPFFTQRGWVAAQDLEPQDVLISVHAAMRMVREEIHDQSFMAADETFLRSILLSEMADEPTRVCCESSYPG
ncbi:MAG: hypothetical protein K8L99_15135, partial [Anaerolineae bacterium]|nr:hypothetical protein [Anaerolineae bacterium]